MSKYEIQIEYSHGRIRPWSANLVINGKLHRDKTGQVIWVARGRKRQTVIRRAKERTKVLRRREERVEERQRIRSKQAVEAAELSERFVIETD